jgi:hypothetical protein
MRGRGPAVVACVAAAVAFIAWLPFLRAPLMPDEAGLLVIGEQWGPGGSLYGDYWVDRPPLLIWMYALIAPMVSLGHTPDGVHAVAIKLAGGAMSAVAVLLAFLAAKRVAPESRWSHGAASVVAAAMLSSPLLGMPSTNGELLAVPFVLGGVALLVPALLRPSARTTPLTAAAAGGCAAAAFLVKQNFIDVFVFAACGFAVLILRRERWVSTFLAFSAGSLAALAGVVGSAVLRGTSVAGLWEATVTFRFQASALMGSEISATRAQRIGDLVTAFVISGAALALAVAVLILLGSQARRRPEIRLLAPPTIALTTWELAAVALGGSYWLHYLTGVVPAAVLLVALAGVFEPRRGVLTVVVALGVIANAGVWAHTLTDPPGTGEDARVATYLRNHASPGDSLLVGFGHSNVYVDAELRGPYPYMWSLPTRVRDPELRLAERVLSGPDAPEWVTVHEQTLAFWDRAGRATRHRVEADYAWRGTIGGWHVWHRRAVTVGRS